MAEAPASTLDRIVKGAPPPNLSPIKVASAARKSAAELDDDENPSVTAPHPPASSDPLSNLPSSPPQIYLNLLILEASLRAQYLTLHARLRLHGLLLGALAAWTLSFTYLLFLRPREDGKGQGGSVYWMIETGEKLGFVGGAVTWGLVWGTGMWDRGVRWPRRFVSTTNRGLRGFNLKLVVLHGPWYKALFGYLVLFDPLGWWTGAKGMRYEQVPRETDRHTQPEKERQRPLTMVEEDIAPGGDTVRLLLQPKSFTPDFRQDWDTFRAAYWEKENKRRSDLQIYIKARNREIAKREGGIFWWISWRGWKRNKRFSNVRALRERPSSSQLRRDKRGGLGDCRPGSRAATPELDTTRSRRPGSEGGRRGSSTQPKTRKKRTSLSGADGRPSSPASTPPTGEPPATRSVTKQSNKLPSWLTGLQSDDRICEETSSQGHPGRNESIR